jgi:inner membrane transporter RhtA
VFLALARPPLRSVQQSDVPALLALGVTSGLVTICFLASLERIRSAQLSPSSSSGP